MCSPLWVALAACGAMTSTSTHIGGPCDAKNKCDSGQICDRTDPGGQVCVDASGDIDGDGIPNGKDFCQHMFGGAFDEDGDGIGDECDACPIAPPPAQAEADGDAVTSPCDPDTRTPGDKILLFNGFNAALAGAGPDWKFADGDAIVTPSAPDAVEQLVFPLATASNRLAILAGYRPDGVATPAATADAGVGTKSVLPLGTSAVQCGGSRAAGTDQVLLFQIDTSGGNTEATKALGTAFSAANPYQVALQLDGATANCAVDGGLTANQGAVRLTIPGDAPTQAVLYARGATVRFSYILVIGQ